MLEREAVDEGDEEDNDEEFPLLEEEGEEDLNIEGSEEEDCREWEIDRIVDERVSEVGYNLL